jgi:acyl-coenzyme A synthetase/AMP-(fatty) acid ligase
VPGRRIGILDDTGRIIGRGRPGAIAVQLPDPVIAGDLSEHTARHQSSPDGEWYITSERGLLDPDGFLAVSR